MKEKYESVPLPFTRKCFQKLAAALIVAKMKKFFGVETGGEDSAVGGDQTGEMIKEFSRFLAPLDTESANPENTQIDKKMVEDVQDIEKSSINSIEITVPDIQFDVSQCLDLMSGQAMKLFTKVIWKIINIGFW